MRRKSHSRYYAAGQNAGGMWNQQDMGVQSSQQELWPNFRKNKHCSSSAQGVCRDICPTWVGILLPRCGMSLSHTMSYQTRAVVRHPDYLSGIDRASTRQQGHTKRFLIEGVSSQVLGYANTMGCAKGSVSRTLPWSSALTTHWSKLLNPCLARSPSRAAT